LLFAQTNQVANDLGAHSEVQCPEAGQTPRDTITSPTWFGRVLV